MNKLALSNWKLAYLDNKTVNEEAFSPKTGEEVSSRLSPIAASVPGNFELDFQKAGLLPDLYFGTNVLQAQKLENLHLYYYTDFDLQTDAQSDAFLVFEGVDTIADIYLDGKLLGRTENMLHAHEFSLDGVPSGKHTLLVHILPTVIYARQFDLPASCFALPYNHDSTEVRKAPYSFGWDIMPRIVSGGLWKPVYLETRKKNRLLDPFTYTVRLEKDAAYLRTAVKVLSDEDFLTDFSIEVELFYQGERCARTKQRCFCANQRIDSFVENAKLWFPKNYGEPHLYDVRVRLWKGDALEDERSYRTGIRTVRLRRTSRSGDDGEFRFDVNGQKVFCLGTNYVPTDAFPSRQEKYDERALNLIQEVGCNMIRLWGGNVYPSQRVYDFCDENGIMIWQDFAFGCGHYPDDERLCRLTKEEIKQVAIAYRNHPSLVLWAGDNECDTTVCQDSGVDHTADGPNNLLNPNKNVLSRHVILQELRNHDATRPYLPSSPYLDETAYERGLPPEEHLWGPRDYFKGDFYKEPRCHFASEIGYHGCNSPESLKKFLPEESLDQMGSSKGCTNPDWLVHAACMETTTSAEGNVYAYRIPLMIAQVERIFTERKENLSDFAKQSQISQAEADKYFIERFRIEKWRKTGIIWWNIIDGWPQVSDAVVDWYGCKKLAFRYIQRAQAPFTLILAEPKDGKMDLYAVNDHSETIVGTYEVTEARSNERIAEGRLEIPAHSSVVIGQVDERDHAFYLLEWNTQKGKGVNHHACSLGEKWTFEAYEEVLKKVGFDEFEGFDA